MKERTAQKREEMAREKKAVLAVQLIRLTGAQIDELYRERELEENEQIRWAFG